VEFGFCPDWLGVVPDWMLSDGQKSVQTTNYKHKETSNERHARNGTAARNRRLRHHVEGSPEGMLTGGGGNYRIEGQKQNSEKAGFLPRVA